MKRCILFDSLYSTSHTHITDEMPLQVKSVSPVTVAFHTFSAPVAVPKPAWGDVTYKNHTDYWFFFQYYRQNYERRLKLWSNVWYLNKADWSISTYEKNPLCWTLVWKFKNISTPKYYEGRYFTQFIRRKYIVYETEIEG